MFSKKKRIKTLRAKRKKYASFQQVFDDEFYTTIKQRNESGSKGTAKSKEAVDLLLHAKYILKYPKALMVELKGNLQLFNFLQEKIELGRFIHSKLNEQIVKTKVKSRLTQYIFDMKMPNRQHTLCQRSFLIRLRTRQALIFPFSKSTASGIN